MPVDVSRRPRARAGIPIGGQFLAKVRCESGVTLDEWEPDGAPANEISRWNPFAEKAHAEEIRLLIADISRIKSSRPSDLADGEYEALPEMTARAERELSELGQRIADEADRRVGVDVHRLIDERKSLTAELQQQAQVAKEKTDAANKKLAEMRDRIMPDGHYSAELYNELRNSPESKQYDEAFAEYISFHRRIAETSLNNGPEIDAAMFQLANAYKTILGEIRPMGGSVDHVYTGANSKLVEQNVTRAMECYPSDWVESSNEIARERPLHLEPIGRDRGARGRAYYQRDGLSVEISRVRSMNSTLQELDFEPNPNDPNHEGMVAGDVAWGTRRVIDPETGKISFVDRQTRVWYRPSWEYRRNKPTRGKEWERTPGIEDGEWKSWRRPAYQMKEQRGARVSKLMVENPKTKGEEAYRTVVHEFAHRFEHTVPGLTDMERAHFERRTASEDGAKNAARIYHKSRRNGVEIVREGTWADTYMGKEYAHGERGYEAFEILSCAVPALMTGKHGGLLGAGRHKADPQSRAFALGALATI